MDAAFVKTPEQSIFRLLQIKAMQEIGVKDRKPKPRRRSVFHRTYFEIFPALFDDVLTKAGNEAIDFLGLVRERFAMIGERDGDQPSSCKEASYAVQNQSIGERGAWATGRDREGFTPISNLECV